MKAVASHEQFSWLMWLGTICFYQILDLTVFWVFVSTGIKSNIAFWMHFEHLKSKAQVTFITCNTFSYLEQPFMFLENQVRDLKLASNTWLKLTGLMDTNLEQGLFSKILRVSKGEQKSLKCINWKNTKIKQY